MKILVVENEIYLAQSISSKLTDIGYNCEIATTLKEAIKDEKFDVVLVSTNISGQNFYPIIEYYKDNSIVILMISYISNDTVSKPLKAGAKDYILKPFMIEELIRKIEHYLSYENLKRENDSLKQYINYTFEHIFIEINYQQQLPLMIVSNSQKIADYFAINYAKKNNLIFQYSSFKSQNYMSKIDSLKYKSMLYLTDFYYLKPNEKEICLNMAKKKNVIISTMEDDMQTIIPKLEIKMLNTVFDNGDVLEIDDYIRFIIMNYQDRYPDTELSKKLGISRKSLWEKRKKYGIAKTK
ncbi:MAG: response regulator [Campylobacterales bacterium]|nr:response regulator [Campylobacterales bacterium]